MSDLSLKKNAPRRQTRRRSNSVPPPQSRNASLDDRTLILDEPLCPENDLIDAVDLTAPATFQVDRTSNLLSTIPSPDLCASPYVTHACREEVVDQDDDESREISFIDANDREVFERKFVRRNIDTPFN